MSLAARTAPERERERELELLTLSEAAALARVHPSTVRAWCVRGRLPSVAGKRSGERRVRRADLQRVVDGSLARRAPPGVATRNTSPSPATRARSRTRAAGEDTLRRLAAELSGSHDPADLYEEVVQAATRIFKADHVAVEIKAAGANEPVEIRASHNIPAEAFAIVRSIPARAETVGNQALRAGTVRVVSTTHPDIDPRLRTIYQQHGISTACFVPIVFGGEPLGIIAVYHDVPYAWSPDELALARSYGDSLATAVGNARLVESVRSLAARLQAVQDLAARLNGLADVRGIGEAIVAEAGSLIRFDTIRVYRTDREAGLCEPIAFQGTFMGTASPTQDMLRVPVGTGLTGWVAEHNEPLMVGDARSDSRGIVVGRVDGPESMLLVPMSFEGTVRGVIVLSRLGVGQFNEDDQMTLTIFAGYAAQAIVSAERLELLHSQHAELEHQLASQRRLIAVNERLLSTLEASSVLELVADSLKAVVTYDSLTIYRVDPGRQVRVPVIARDRFADVILGYEAPLGTGITGWAVDHREAVLANDAIHDPRSVQIPGTPVEPQSLIVVPLIAQGEVLGTLNVSRIGAAEARFSQNEFELTKLFAAQAAIALRNADTHGQMKVQAEHDALTGLRNHGSFQREFGAAILAAGAQPLSVLMMDLDRFKTYNDTLGHPAGDDLLTAVARAIEASIRTVDSAYRYGGDEFAVILPNSDRAGAEEVAERIRTAVTALRGNRSGPAVSISVGIACHPDDGPDKTALMETADAALYEAKGSHLRSSVHDPLVVALDETAGLLLEGGATDDLLASILARAGRLLGTEHAYLSMVESNGTHLKIRAGLGLYREIAGRSMPADLSVAGTVCRTGRPFAVDDYDTFAGRTPDPVAPQVGAVLGVPLMSRGRVIGMIGVASGANERPWQERDLDALSRFAQLASIGLENARLQEAAVHGPADSVTGLPTREQLVESIDLALQPDADQHGAPQSVAVVLLDIDRFKVINESLGHQAGDRVLAEVGRRVATVLGDQDLVARFGGDEFGLLLNPADYARAEVVAERVLSALKAPMELDGRLWFISASLGFAVGRPGEAISRDLLREAGLALVQAQQEPTARIARFDPLRSRVALDRLDLETDLQGAIERDEFIVHYQPIVDLRTERIMGFEALVRWQHPERGLISPAAFIPLAEETDLIIPLGVVVLAKACRQAQVWRDQWPTERLVMSVNLSPRQFADSELVASIASVLTETGLDPSALELEITETAVMDRSEASLRALGNLRALGVRLVLDDFGTGYSSLAQLRHLPLDTIKIDRSFVTELDEDDPNVAIVQTVLTLAHGLGITVVAEGIENSTQAERLRELGCDMGQGYLWAKPIAPEFVGALLTDAAAQRRLPNSRSRNRNRLMKSR